MHFEHLQAVCLPIGFADTAGQVLACALTAHPNMVIGNHCDSVKNWWNRGELLTTDAFLSGILEMDRKMHLDEMTQKERKRYYRISDQWQGRFERLTIIGDCSPDSNTGVLAKKHCEPLLAFSEKIQLPLKFIFLVRNPYDMISEKVIASYSKNTPKEKFDMIVPNFIESCALRENFLARITSMPEYSVFIWHLEDHIANPQRKLAELCSFLNIESTESYLDACSKIFYKKPKQSRYLINWPEKHKALVAAAIKQYNFFPRYCWTS